MSWACGSDEPYRPDPQATFSPAALAFEMTAIGDTARRTVALTSRFPRDFEVTVGSRSPEFSVEGPEAFTLGAGKTRELVVRFHPATEGAKEGRVEVEGIRCDPLPCTGTADDDPCRVEPKELAFGWVRLGEAKTLALRVYGDGPEAVAGEVAASCEEFEVSPVGPFTLAPGESLEVEVTYRPRDRGEDGCGVSLGHFWCEEVACRGTSSRQWWVQEDGGGDAQTVQAAIDSAGPGDVVVVEPGRYYENIDLLGKGIHLKSAEGPERTILDGSRGDDTVVACVSGETNATVIEGFTITGGKGRIRAINGRMGGGLYLGPAAPIVRGNIVTGNRAESPPEGNMSWAGALSGYSLTDCLILEENRFEGNFATTNAGGVLVAGQCRVVENVFLGNSTARGDGGALYIQRTPRSIYCGNIFMGNRAGDHGGAIVVYNFEPAAVSSEDIEICHNVLLFNDSSNFHVPECSGGGIYIGGSAYVHHNTIAYNTSSSGYPPTGGGICLVSRVPGTKIEHNVFLSNLEGAIVAYRNSDPGGEALVRRNLFFRNGTIEVFNAYEADFALELEENVFEDPLFCVDGPGSDGSVAANSPALRQPWGIIGAVDEPGCGPRESLPRELVIGGSSRRKRAPSSLDSGEERRNE